MKQIAINCGAKLWVVDGELDCTTSESLGRRVLVNRTRVVEKNSTKFRSVQLCFHPVPRKP
jgi:hypothetical protein